MINPSAIVCMLINNKEEINRNDYLDYVSMRQLTLAVLILVTHHKIGMLVKFLNISLNEHSQSESIEFKRNTYSRSNSSMSLNRLILLKKVNSKIVSKKKSHVCLTNLQKIEEDLKSEFNQKDLRMEIERKLTNSSDDQNEDHIDEIVEKKVFDLNQIGKER